MVILQEGTENSEITKEFDVTVRKVKGGNELE